ncbi:hypothetical protein Tc00.1047053506529.595 [Trypanosoma cruzi]|uniref:Uncharacterized protein n=1 Tax=Trypanosoma cruzi (strain CL Brener) TaxID=353153 RepID=Q4E5M2_TRYCC|nr:hypothetical protein Tc00.1047053506529.595 [Trypanosoma cruzi]EAO00128.1 hypothetical protein Tc00.1047053506529.595 [Trypanosoma cruzi]|eukprot:XP_821979.1 hypothetical protein [Trypanosoma cruzi strain CL Brener]
MSYDGCFAECMKPTVKGDFKVLDQHSSWSSAQVPSQFSCRTTNLSFHQIGGGLTASRDSEAHSERIFSEDSEHGISLLPGGCRESFGEYGNFALTEGRFPLHRFEDETDTITQGEGTNEGRELGCNLPPSVSHFWPPFPPPNSESAEFAETAPPAERANYSQSFHHTGIRSECVLGGSTTSLLNFSSHHSGEGWWATRNINSLERPKHEQHPFEPSPIVSPFFAPVQLLKLRGQRPELDCCSVNSNSNWASDVDIPQRGTHVEMSVKLSGSEVASARAMSGLRPDWDRSKRGITGDLFYDEERSDFTEPPRKEPEERRMLRQKCLNSDSYFATRRGVHKVSLERVRRQFKQHFIKSKFD